VTALDFLIAAGVMLVIAVTIAIIGIGVVDVWQGRILSWPQFLAMFFGTWGLVAKAHELRERWRR
jgi:EamA domain-containing membrane protein RarD